MSTQINAGPGSAPRKHTPYVPETMQMKEFTLRALLIGLVMTGNPRFRQCLSRLESRDDDCRYVSRCRHRDGIAAIDERFIAGRKHCANRGLNR